MSDFLSDAKFKLSVNQQNSHHEGFLRGQADFAMLVNSINDYGIFLMDAGGHIQTWNAGAQKINGYWAEDVIGKHFSLFYTQEDKDIGHPAKELNIAASVGRYEEEG